MSEPADIITMTGQKLPLRMSVGEGVVVVTMHGIESNIEMILLIRLHFILGPHRL